MTPLLMTYQGDVIMSFVETFFSFEGRLNRQPYILRFLMRNILIWFVGCMIILLLNPHGTMFAIFAFALNFAVVLSCLSLYVRRLHDLNHTAILVLWAFLPITNFILAFYLIFFRGTIGPNRYGPDPLN